MSEIPEDIYQLALEAWTSVPTADWESNAVEVIARAILAERERCKRLMRFYLDEESPLTVIEDAIDRGDVL